MITIANVTNAVQDRPICPSCKRKLRGWIEHNRTICECGKQFVVKWYGNKLVVVNETNLNSHT